MRTCSRRWRRIAWPTWPGVPEKTEVILGGMIANVQVRNVQKSRSGLTRMAKLTFEDLTGSTPAMLWPEEFAKHGDLVKNDLIGFVKGTLDRRRDPAELIVSRIIPIETGRRRAGPRRRRPAPQGGPPGRAPRAAAPARPRPPGQPRPLSRDRRPGTASAARSTRRAPSLRVRYDDRLVIDLENAVGPGIVRLLGHRGATTRIDSGNPPAAASRRPGLASTPASDLETDDISNEDSDDL